MTVELRGIGRRFGERWILQQLDLKVEKGECVALLGASGCGKSTALRLIAGLDQPDCGELLIEGEPMDRVPARQRRIGMVFQSYALFPISPFEATRSRAAASRWCCSGQAATDRGHVGCGAVA